MTMKLHQLAAPLAFLLACSGAYPQDQEDAVVVTAVRDPVDKSYRKMVRGMDLFEQMHSLAPKAALRFKLLPRRRTTKMDDIDVQIVGNSFETPVEVAADHTF